MKTESQLGFSVSDTVVPVLTEHDSRSQAPDSVRAELSNIVSFFIVLISSAKVTRFPFAKAIKILLPKIHFPL